MPKLDLFKHNGPPSYHSNNEDEKTEHKSIWRFPPLNFYKLNTDGSTLKLGQSTFGCVVRDCHGTWVCGYAGKMGDKSSKFSSEEAEVWALHRGLKFVIGMRLSKVMIEIECENVLRMIEKRVDITSHVIKHDIKDIIEMLKDH